MRLSCQFCIKTIELLRGVATAELSPDGVSITILISALPFHILGSLLGHGTDHEEAAPSLSKIMLVQATGGIIAGATASCITTPLDTIKTRLQVVHIELSSSIFISYIRTRLLDMLLAFFLISK